MPSAPSRDLILTDNLLADIGAEVGAGLDGEGGDVVVLGKGLNAVLGATGNGALQRRRMSPLFLSNKFL